MSAINPLDAAAYDDIRSIRFTWVDLTNMVRYRIIPVAFFKKILAQQRPAISLATAVFGIVNVQLAKGFPATGEILLIPDLTSLRICGYEPATAVVFGYLQVKDPVPGQEIQVPFCPRSILHRVIETAKKEQGIDFRIGFETEFILLKSTSPLEMANEYGWSLAGAIQSGSNVSKALAEISDCLTTANIEVEMYHSEAAPGQYEFVVGHMTPLEAVDALIMTRETIYNIASKYGFKATLAPRLHLDTCGSAAHMHFSLKSSIQQYPSAKVPNAKGLTTLDTSFLQSLIDHLPSICAISLPTEGSYARMVDGAWAGGTYASWGRENRETPIRLCGVAPNYHWEVRCLDGTACPYIAVAAMLHAGLLGVRNNLELRTKETAEMPASLTPEQRSELGITKRLPLNVAQAKEYLKNDKDMRELFTEDVVNKYVSVNTLLNDIVRGSSERETMENLVKMF